MKLEDVQELPHHIRLIIPEDYLDIFRHMNVQYYLKIFNDSVFDMFAGIGMDENYFYQNELAMFAVDQRLSFHAEVKAGETVAIYSRLINRSDKKLHFKFYMINETQNTVSATMEGLGFHVSKQTKRSTAFLDTVASRLDKRLAEHRALDWEVELSEAIRV